jgi:hypothetical protein
MTLSEIHSDPEMEDADNFFPNVGVMSVALFKGWQTFLRKIAIGAFIAKRRTNFGVIFTTPFC